MDTKTGASLRPLSHAACEVLRALPRLGELVFPASIGADKLMRGFHKVWLRVASEGCPRVDVTPHVLRHSYASIAADLGFSELTIAALLGHRRRLSPSKYAHHADAVLLQAADASRSSPSLLATPARPASSSNCRSGPDRDGRPELATTHAPNPEDGRVRFAVVVAYGTGHLRARRRAEQRLRLVRRFAFRAYRAVCRHLGEEEARKLFDGFISPSPREERPRGPHDARRDRELLAEYGRLAAKATTPAERAKLPRRVAESRVRGLEDTAEADQKHLRRLLHRRERETALLLARNDRLRRRMMGDAEEPTTLLGQVLAERDKK